MSTVPATRVLLAALLFLQGASPRARAQSVTPRGASAGAPPELVVLVHGMGRSARSMRPMAKRLEAEGYQVLNWGYSSTCCTIAQLGGRLADTLRAYRPAHRRIHFVTHSLGSLLVRWVLAQQSAPDSVGRIVMLAPPNRGSRAADRLGPLLKGIYPPIRELGTGPGGAARTIPVPRGLEIGIIVGRYDGKVSLDEARLEGYAEPLVVPAAHSFMMRRRDVQQLTIRFLRTGRFR